MSSNTRRFWRSPWALALLVVLDSLTPAERLAFVLHDVFRVPFADIASALDRFRSRRPAARQPRPLARAQLAGARPRPRRADGSSMRSLPPRAKANSMSSWRCSTDVELRIDGGVLRAEASLVLRGAGAVAAHTATYSKLYPFVRPALVNGAAGAVVSPPGRVFSVMAFTVTNEKIAQIDVLLDPERLEELDLNIPPTAGNHR